MTDYTPTTEEVRDNYLPPRTEIKDADEQFDRWLAEHDREVKEQAQAGLFWNDQVMILMGQAWDEGWDAGASWPQPYKWDNPYREETE